MDIYNNPYYKYSKGQKREVVLATQFMRKMDANDWRLKYLYKHIDSSFTNFGIHVKNPNYTIDVSGNINNTLDYYHNTLDYYHNGYLLVPVGTVSPYAGFSAPGGWFICDGASYSRTTYNKLFGVIGTAYGSVDGNSFNIPNLKGRAPFGYDSTIPTFDTSGNKGGSATKTLSVNEMPSHTHTSNATGNLGITSMSNGDVNNTVGNPDQSAG